MARQRMNGNLETADGVKATLRRFYQGSGYDIWGDGVPSRDEFLDVVRDRTHDDLRGNTFWNGLTRSEQDALILSVGP